MTESSVVVSIPSPAFILYNITSQFESTIFQGLSSHVCVVATVLPGTAPKAGDSHAQGCQTDGYRIQEIQTLSCRDVAHVCLLLPAWDTHINK